MSVGIARLLIALYPRQWRERYGDEFEAMLEIGRGGTLMAAVNVVWCAICERVRSWSAWPPWTLFGLAPIAILMAIYLIACLTLWSGWRLYFPESPTPFVPVYGSAIYYFGLGRLLYYAAPILAGWSIGLTAACQKSRSIWPAAGLIAVAVLGAAARVQVSRGSDISAAGQVGLRFDPSTAWHGFFSTLYGPGILALTMLPWLIWRTHRSFARSS